MDPTPPAMPPPMPASPVRQQTNGLAVASLVLGILAIILCVTIVFPLILGTLAVIFGALGIGKANRGAGNKGLAIAGLICGIVGIGAMILIVAFFTTATVEIINDVTPSISPMS